MKLTILGCDGSYPSANGACSGYLVTHEGQRVLMDCGTGVLAKLFALMDPAELSAVIITHWHFDHTSDLLSLTYYLQRMGKTLDIYAPDADEPMRALCSGGVYRLHDLAELRQVGPFVVETLPGRHPTPTYLVKLRAAGRSLVYTGDTNYFDGLVPFCHDADVLLCDAAFPVKDWTEALPHLSATGAAELALATEHAQLVLTHVPPYQDRVAIEKECRAIYPHCQSATPGLVVTV
ncbi:MAG: MBL fold metallo-hydrolase [Eubacteriales bacterium]|nr:MBL fold metallo-hydrolase [Eubacteriales bacterium]MDD4105320.1 MBL fold metallo-hydrolase [Eubacteriales bacterium]MDD4711322.1 MBL fold metallo-hydrolase [Eubacteriales bacterium]